MGNVWWIMRRELGRYLRQPTGYIILAASLLVAGILFNTWATGLGEQRRLSSEVLESFFYFTSGLVIIASVFNAMRLIAEEKEQATLVLLATSPVRDWQLVAGKFFAALTFLAVLLLCTSYMPALVMVNGKVSLGHIFAGYLGLLLIGAASIAIGIACSAMASSQLVAAFLGAAVIVVFILFWLIAKVASPPVEGMLEYLSLHHKHFQPFMRGLVNTRDIVFYVSFSYLALMVATRVLEARRWRA